MSADSLKDKTAKGLMWGSISNIAQLLLGTGFGIVLARLLSPADYGMVGLLTVFSQIASVLQDSGFRIALVNRREFRHEDYNAVFWFNVLTGCALYLLLFFLAPLITAFYQQSDTPAVQDLSALTPLARFSFLGFVASSMGMVHYAYLLRTLQVRQKAIITISSLIVSGSIGVGMALGGYAYWGLAAQNVAFCTCNTLLFWYFSRWRPTLPVSFRPLKEMFGFSSRILLTDLCNYINNNLLTIIMGRFYSVSDVGHYNQANKWATMGNTLVSGTIREVAQPVLRGVETDRERHKRVFRKMLRFTAFIAFPTLFGLAFISRELIVIAVGEKWLPCAPLMQILCVGALIYPLQYLCSSLLITKERSGIIFWNNLATGLTQLCAVILSYPYGIHTMVCTYVGVSVVWLFIWFLLVRHEIRLRLREAFADLVPYALLATAAMAATAFLTRDVENLYLLFGLKIGMAAALYALLSWACGSATFRECMGFLLRRGKPSH